MIDHTETLLTLSWQCYIQYMTILRLCWHFPDKVIITYSLWPYFSDTFLTMFIAYWYSIWPYWDFSDTFLTMLYNILRPYWHFPENVYTILRPYWDFPDAVYSLFITTRLWHDFADTFLTMWYSLWPHWDFADTFLTMFIQYYDMTLLRLSGHGIQSIMTWLR